MSLVDAALAYARRGIRVIPITPRSKVPLIDAWPTQASSDETTIRAWWKQWPNAGIGIATGKAGRRQFFVLDIDDKNGKNGSDTLAELEADHGKLPDTITVLTGSGGRHLYFTTNVEIRNDSGKRLGEGLDIRGEAGYVVAPPTIHENGREYAFEHGYTMDDIAPAEAPGWLMHRLTVQPKIDRAKPHDHDDFLHDPNLPSSRFDAAHTWQQLLEADGWKFAYEHNGTEYWTRPGKDKGVSASLNHNGNDALIVFSTNAPVPEGGYTRFGYWAQKNHGGDWKKASAAYTKTAPTPTPEPHELLGMILNWQEFWDQDHKSEDWIAYPLIARGRQTALFAVAKVGKSYLTLACVAALATGKPIFGRPAQPPVKVLYLDYEMTPGDLKDRLQSLGYFKQDDLSNLYYAVIPSLPPLNTFEGSAALMKLVELTGAQVVVIDTTGRAVEGEENSADTYREFARTTGLALKAAGIALLRTDHAGKDKGKTQGQRGSSAKNDDVDLVYRMERDGATITLERMFSRISWAPIKVELIEDQLEESHTPIRLAEAPETFTEATFDLARRLMDAFPHLRPGIKHQDSSKFRDQIREAGIKVANNRISPALRAIYQGKVGKPEQF